MDLHGHFRAVFLARRELARAHRGDRGLVEPVTELLRELDVAHGAVVADDEVEHDGAFDAGGARVVGVLAGAHAARHRRRRHGVVGNRRRGGLRLVAGWRRASAAGRSSARAADGNRRSGAGRRRRLHVVAEHRLVGRVRCGCVGGRWRRRARRRSRRASRGRDRQRFRRRRRGLRLGFRRLGLRRDRRRLGRRRRDDLDLDLLCDASPGLLGQVIERARDRRVQHRGQRCTDRELLEIAAHLTARVRRAPSDRSRSRTT